MTEYERRMLTLALYKGLRPAEVEELTAYLGGHLPDGSNARVHAVVEQIAADHAAGAQS